MGFDHFDWLSQFYSEWKPASKLVNLKISGNVRVCDLGQNLKMTKTSSFCSIHQENVCKSCLHSKLITLTDFHSFPLNEDKLQNSSIWRFLLTFGYAIFVKTWKWLKLFNFTHQENICKSSLYSNLIILTEILGFTVIEDKLQNYSIVKVSAKVWVCDFGQNLKMRKTV